jgi:signal transduction histidine kinase
MRPITTEDWAQLAQNRRFDSLGTFAGGIAHDLKNALTPILLSSQMLLQDEHDETNRRLLRSIESSAIHGASLINRVLRFVRGGENTSYLIDAGAIITTVIDRVRDTLPAEFTIDISLGQRPILILGDTTQLQQVLLNLISNAREAMTSGGKISIRASVNGATNAAVIIEVEDSGTGIPEEHLEEIFQPLFTTKALGGGTGLGLSTSLRIVTAWGGTLSAVNNHGAGATFRLTLPHTPQHTDRNSNNGPNSATPGATLP